jgi:histidine kinase
MEEVTTHSPRLRPWQRLSIKLTLWLAACLVVLTVLAVWVGTRTLEERALQRMLRTGSWFSDTVKRATRYGMLRDQRDNVHQIITAIGRQPGVEAIRVFNKQGRIMFSSRREEIGRMVDMQAEACYGCHARDVPLERLPQGKRSRIFTVRARPGRPVHRVLGVINPIYTEPACYTDPCHVHPPGQKVLGVLDVALSLADVDRELQAAGREVIATALLIFLVMTALLVVLSYLFVSRPLAGLVHATQRIARGDYEQPVTYRSQDEIGFLARNFELMRQSIKEKTEALDESRRQFQTLFEQVPCYISVQDRDFRLVACNKMFERDFGQKVGEYCYQAYKGRDSKCPHCAVEKTFQDGRMHSAEEIVIGADGQPHYFLNLTAPITDRQGNIVAVMEMATDVTDLRRLEQELRKSEEKYRLFFNNDPNPIFVFDRENFEILDANQRASSQYGYPRQELVGRSFLELTDPADQERVRRFLEAGESLLARVHQLKKDGSVVMVNMRAAYGEYLGRQAVIVAAADISETLKTEQQLVQAAKMATLGEMSAGVAHELNQPLSVIATAGNLLRKNLTGGRSPDPEVLRQVAEELIAQVERCSRIINHLREFGRKSKVERSRVDLHQPIEGVFHLLGQQLRVHDIAVEAELPDELPPVWGDVNRLEQVFVNLVMNARDAIEERRARGQRLQGQIHIAARRQGDMVEVAVSDNGVGIPPQLRDRIFEPFFTTKEVGKGTGLGLSISYGIVRDYNGSLEVHPNPQGGATFVVRLPVAREDG